MATSFVLLHFELNQERIATELCVEKDIPDSCCKGKCYLNDALEKAEKPIDQQQELPQWVNWDWIAPVSPSESTSNDFTEKAKCFCCQESIRDGIHRNIDFPPELI
ncbi:MAG: hypothetical protein P8H98_01960 [Flavobacteriales bacterium]|nr:hypothetical protein [Flavobacteriales bacterium]